jgi:hypothetical protein
MNQLRATIIERKLVDAKNGFEKVELDRARDPMMLWRILKNVYLQEALIVDHRIRRHNCRSNSQRFLIIPKITLVERNKF